MMPKIFDYVRYVAVIILIICAALKAVRSKNVDVKPAGCSFWLPLVASSIGILMTPRWISSIFPEPRLYLFTFVRPSIVIAQLLLLFAFIIAAIAVLTEKRLFCIFSSVLSAVGVILISVLRLIVSSIYYGAYDLVTVSLIILAPILLTIAVICQYKMQKAFPRTIWGILIAICLLVGCLWLNLTLIAMALWLSPKSEKKLTLPKMELPKTSKNSAKPNASPTDTADKLKALETLQGLLNNGAITQEEFDAKKKQLLGM